MIILTDYKSSPLPKNSLGKWLSSVTRGRSPDPLIDVSAFQMNTKRQSWISIRTLNGFDLSSFVNYKDASRVNYIEKKKITMIINFEYNISEQSLIEGHDAN